MSDDGTVRAVERAIGILQSFTPEQPSLSVIDLKARTGLSRPTLYRLLATLIGCKLVKAEGDPQRFSLDYGVAAFTRSWAAQIDIVALANPILEVLREETGETVSLLVFQDDALLCVQELPSRHGLAISRGLGRMQEHLSQGASGKAILAHLGDVAIRRILATLPADHSPVEAALARVRAEGCSISYGEVLVGVVAMAAPVFGQAGAVVGTVGLFGPQARLDRDRIAEMTLLVKKAAGQLSGRLGHAETQSRAS